MEIEHLSKIINEGEGIQIEYKKATDTIPSSFYETVVSFSNTDGGVILLGVDDDGVVTGIEPTAVINMKKNIVTALNTPDCIFPSVYVQPFTIQHPDGLVMVVQIQVSSQVHDHAGHIYIREFETDIDITDNRQKVSDLYFNKRNTFTETQIFPFLQMEDLDEKLFIKARNIIYSYKSDHPWLMVDNEQMLRESSLWRKDVRSGEDGLTLAAALIFGKDSTIQSILPAYKVEAMVRIENEDRWDDRIMPPLRTNLIDTYLLLKEFINKHLPEKFYLEADQRIDLRDKIFREVIGNLCCHREYTSPISSDLIITKTEVTLTNPNKALFHGVLNPNSFNPSPKNPNIRKFFTAFGWADEIGSGIRNTNKFLPLYSYGAKPTFTEGEIFTTVIPLRNSPLNIYATKFVEWLELSPKSEKHLLNGLASVSLPANLVANEWNDVISYLVPSWNKKGTQLSILDWPENKPDTKHKAPNDTQSMEKGIQSIGKKGRYIISILLLCTHPINMKELMEYIGYKNDKTFRDNYINPLKSLQFISLTKPMNPNASDNKYTITEAGKVFLV